jgi:hypothetical protein
MAATFLLEWTFTPPDLFEERVSFAIGDCAFVIEAGKAEGHIAEDKYPEDQSRRNELHQLLDAVFLAAQLLSHKSYTLAKPSVARLRADGSRDVWVFPEGATMTMSVGNADFIVHESTGKVVRDSRRERIDRRVRLALDAAGQITDPALNAILRSYAAAVNDPRNELVHLYEIRDALATHFGGETAARAALGITADQWSTLGRLSNSDPLTQGRHRGKQLGALREATAAELGEARAIARSMVEGYLAHLKKMP